MRFFNYFFGYLSQVLPCALLCLIPALETYKENQHNRGKLFLNTLLLSLVTGLFFASASTYFTWLFVGGKMPYSLTYLLINGVFIGMTVVCFVIFLHKISFDLPHHLFLFLFTFNYGMLVSVFSMIFSSLTPHETFYTGLPYKFSVILFLTGANLLLLPLFGRLLQKLWRLFPVDSQEITGPQRLFFLLPIPFIALTLFCALMGSDELFSNLLFILLLVGLLVAQLTFYWFLATFISNTIQLTTQKQQYQLAIENYHSMQRHLEALRVFRHEFNRHLLTISGYLSSENQQEAQIYIQNLLDEPTIAEPLLYCRHPLINALLYSFLPELKQAGVEVTCNVILPEKLALPDDHLTGLLYNILQNAADSCLFTLKQKGDTQKVFLQLKIFIRQEHLVVSCCNTCTHSVLKDNLGRILSSKKDTSGHGYGLQIIQNIVRLHDGILEHTYQKENSSFQLSAALHLDSSDSSAVYRGGAL